VLNTGSHELLRRSSSWSSHDVEAKPPADSAMPGATGPTAVAYAPSSLRYWGYSYVSARFCTRATRRPATWNVIGWA
jgi:hypothetical protein